MIEADDALSGMPPHWYVAFYDGDRRYWWSSLCRPGFRHVAAFGYCADQAAWLLYDVTTRRTLIRMLTPSQMDAWVEALPDNRRIVAFEPVGEPVEPGVRIGFWCTPAVAHLVGARSRALRPEAFYRDLIAQGARPAFESRQA
jgi:hypothetical protein